jgi:hypothetical protein
MKWLAIAMAIGSLTACGDSGGSSPTAPTAAPTPAATPANVGGSYNLTITASSTCSASLPSETRVLSYIANVSQTEAAINVQLLAHVIWTTATVFGIVAGQTITFSTFSFGETTTGGGVALGTTGTANVAADGSITGSLSGAYQTTSGSNCTAANHQLQMVKR